MDYQDETLVGRLVHSRTRREIASDVTMKIEGKTDGCKGHASFLIAEGLVDIGEQYDLKVSPDRVVSVQILGVRTMMGVADPEYDGIVRDDQRYVTP